MFTMKRSVAFCLILIPITISTQCFVCDSFQGYCDFDGSTCVGPKCSRRTAPMTNGLIREQRICVPSDSPIGCRKAVLWDEMEGVECVCEGHLCNIASFFSITCPLTLIIFMILF